MCAFGNGPFHYSELFSDSILAVASDIPAADTLKNSYWAWDDLGCGCRRQFRKRRGDPYGLVCKAGVWYLVADSGGEARLFRVSWVVSAVADEEPVRRRDGVELAPLWESLRRQVEDRPAPVPVVARVRRERLDMFCRICAANLASVAAEVIACYSNTRLHVR